MQIVQPGMGEDQISPAGPWMRKENPEQKPGEYRKDTGCSGTAVYDSVYVCPVHTGTKYSFPRHQRKYSVPRRIRMQPSRKSGQSWVKS